MSPPPQSASPNPCDTEEMCQSQQSNNVQRLKHLQLSSIFPAKNS